MSKWFDFKNFLIKKIVKIVKKTDFVCVFKNEQKCRANLKYSLKSANYGIFNCWTHEQKSKKKFFLERNSNIFCCCYFSEKKYIYHHQHSRHQLLLLQCLLISICLNFLTFFFWPQLFVELKIIFIF